MLLVDFQPICIRGLTCILLLIILHILQRRPTWTFFYFTLVGHYGYRSYHVSSSHFLEVQAWSVHWQIDCRNDLFEDDVVMFLAMSMEIMVRDGTNCINDDRFCLLGIRLSNSELRLGYLRLSSSHYSSLLLLP